MKPFIKQSPKLRPKEARFWAYILWAEYRGLEVNSLLGQPTYF
ncbi:hypothetical protein [Flavobacterium sp. WC2416]|uniref:Uncharacterized protein n=1 Tax=Flavobacterium sp. WC2416 TaxID=3234141 RepID=A0AB39W7M9_9FLAO